MNPDFININGEKKVIELFGEHWHDTEEKGQENRINKFKQFGFDCIVIWGKELKDKNWEHNILNKIGYANALN